MNVQVLGDDVVYGFDWKSIGGFSQAVMEASKAAAAQGPAGATSGGWIGRSREQMKTYAQKAWDAKHPRPQAGPGYGFSVFGRSGKKAIQEKIQKGLKTRRAQQAAAMPAGWAQVLAAAKQSKVPSVVANPSFTKPLTLPSWWSAFEQSQKAAQGQQQMVQATQAAISHLRGEGDEIDAAYSSTAYPRWSALGKARSSAGMFGDDVVYGGEILDWFGKAGQAVKDTVQTPGGTAAVLVASTFLSPTDKAHLAELQAAMGITPQTVNSTSRTPVVTPAPWLDEIKSVAPYVLLGGAALFAVVMLTKKKRHAPAAA